MNKVFVMDTRLKPLMPCSPRRAKKLLTAHKAAVYRRYPFTIVLSYKVNAQLQPIAFKIDPGSKVTGIALVASFPKQGKVCIFALNLVHRGQAIKDALYKRASLRRSRRTRNTRYRKPRFNNRTRPSDWIPPSIMHRVLTTMSWLSKIRSRVPISSIAMELVNFDPNIVKLTENGRFMEYPLHCSTNDSNAYVRAEARAFILHLHKHTCVYCGATNVPLQIDHIVPRSKNGSNRRSNLTVACEQCNQAKSNRSIKDFLANDPIKLKRILANVEKPLRDVAAVNSSKEVLKKYLEEIQLPLTTGSGAMTKINRTTQGYPKDHWIDAVCVGLTGLGINIPSNIRPLIVKAIGHGNRQVTRVDQYGFPRGYKSGRCKRIYGFQTGDMVELNCPNGKYIGRYVTRIIGIRARGDFDIKIDKQVITSSHRNFKLIQRGDGYAYSL